MTTGTERTLSEPTTDVCDACNGTGIEEGREWDGHPCSECKGTKFITIDDSDPSPWCSGGHMSEASCTCGEIDSHD